MISGGVDDPLPGICMREPTQLQIEYHQTA